MNKLGINDIVQEKMTIRVEDDTDGLLITIDGIIDMEDPGIILDPFFQSVHQSSIQNNIQKINVNLTGLNFLNSSGIKCLAKWVLGLSQVSEDKRYKIIIKQNPTITWQKTSLITLTYAAPGLISVV
jgi:hypothetical protein